MNNFYKPHVIKSNILSIFIFKFSFTLSQRLLWEIGRKRFALFLISACHKESPHLSTLEQPCKTICHNKYINPYFYSLKNVYISHGFLLNFICFIYQHTKKETSSIRRNHQKNPTQKATYINNNSLCIYFLQ